ncbi:flavin-containing monooxygenase [Gordonia rubripertincta]|uniref:NAD(P)/FAD-dependent oxidoreductase n=1 Tax=Gordonia rubripertincta TaxID=36822 RepID=A0ABT4MV08_GORRU|nr:NAD(P)/FAD-dependent oxidoreductase [Gordonia rubripertincta]MCZ4550849.1 NAD(P)/FAD-dependent oxidoreductase [Gordonia rubripertincta]
MPNTPDHVDVLIIGAGLSGIGAACHIRKKFPTRSIAILEARSASGGTWDLFRYPGIRSDSDMFTLGYRFRPWSGDKAIADGPSILQYVRDTADEYGIDNDIRYNSRAVRAEWFTTSQSWNVTVEHTDTGETSSITAGFVMSCSGYYRYDEGYTPEFAGVEDFEGTIVHPQHWPDDLDYTDKQVVIIGSGATAVTLAPSMAADAAHVTLLQRSPSYIISVPAEDALANRLRRVLPAPIAYSVSRGKAIAVSTALYQLCRRFPNFMRARIRDMQIRQLPDVDVDTHFNPRYNPWDQRLCLVPNSDLFRAIRRGSVSMATDTISRFTPGGIDLESGQKLSADVIVTATGLNLLALGGLTFVVDGDEVILPETMTYKGLMLSGIPNFAYIVGYTNASWTLKADLVCDYVCRLLRHMDTGGYGSVVARRDPSVKEEPFLDFAAGYVLRSVNTFPHQGSRAPWRLRMNYYRDVFTLRRGSVADGAVEFAPKRAELTDA